MLDASLTRHKTSWTEDEQLESVIKIKLKNDSVVINDGIHCFKLIIYKNSFYAFRHARLLLRRWSSVGAECASHRNLPHALSYQLEQSITTGSTVASFSHFKSQNHSKPEANISVKNRGKLLVLKLRLICNMESPLVYEPCIKFGKGEHTKLFAHIMILKYIYLAFPTCKQVDCTLWYYLVNTPLYNTFLIIIIFK